MKRLLFTAFIAMTAGPALAQVSIAVDQPGVYGRIDLGGFPQPQLMNEQPVYAERPLGRDGPPPIYLHVPPGYELHWRDHCGEYGACGQPVFFVRDDWYRSVYRPRYREVHGYDHGERRFEEGRGERREERFDDRRGEPRGDRRDDRRDERQDERRDGR